MEAQERKNLKDKKRIVIKIGSSSLTHPETGELNLMKIEKLIRTLSDLRGQGKDVVLVSSGAIAAGSRLWAITSARTPWRKNRPLPLWGRPG